SSENICKQKNPDIPGPAATKGRGFLSLKTRKIPSPIPDFAICRTCPDVSGFLAGEAGFEPAHHGVKVRCLTSWLLPIGQFYYGSYRFLVCTCFDQTE